MTKRAAEGATLEPEQRKRANTAETNGEHSITEGDQKTATTAANATMGSAGGNHALIFGASGITGWAIVNQILNGYPDTSSFSKVTAMTNRPLSQELSQWPKSDKLNIVSGLDLLKGSQEDLETALKSRVDGVNTVSHVYFFAYIMDADPAKEISINVDLLQRAITAIDNLSPNLKFVVLPTGTKAYGVHLMRDNFPHANNLPLKESHPRIPEPYASEMFYYNQLDLLKALSANKPWTFCDVIPDMIVGFVPHNNIYCLPQALALYLSLYRYMHSEGAEVVFPGTTVSWENLSNDSCQDLIARFAIQASLHPEASAGQSYNTADHSKPSTWSAKWPVICKFFGLKGVAPTADKGGSGPDPVAYVVDNRDKWLELEKKHGLQTGRVGNDRSFGGFAMFIMSMLDFDRQLDLSKAHGLLKRVGAEVDEWSTEEAWYPVFERFRRAKIIP